VSALDRARRFPAPAVRLGGSGTLISASANLTVAGIAERNGVPFRFVTYALYGMPMMVVSVAISHVYVWWRYF
jgi:Na+/H+ antiporter NhaD/arsenite permease-like protein